MTALFLKLLNMSITAGWTVLAVILLRLLLKKMPKQLTCMLWILVGIRLVLPFSPESIFSLIPSSRTLPETITPGALPEINSGFTVIDHVVNPAAKASFSILSTGRSGSETVQFITKSAVLLWITGMCLMLGYLIFSYLHLIRKMDTAVRLKDNIWQSEAVKSPFILGLTAPRIYIPFGLSDTVLAHVLAHEKAHLARKDHLVKAFAFLLLSVYWFQPLIWAAYILLCRDIELACDERVIRDYSEEQRKSYLLSLIGYDSAENRKKSYAPACPLAFGEVDLKERIVRAKTWKKPALILVIPALMLCCAAAFCLLTNPKSAPEKESLPHESLYSWRTKYIGDNSAVGNIIYNLTFPEDMAYQQFALQTGKEPYEVTVTFAMSEDVREQYHQILFRAERSECVSQSVPCPLEDMVQYAARAKSCKNEIALLQKNACIMFSLIENAGTVNFKLVDETDAEKSPLTFVYTRQEAEAAADCDLWVETETPEKFEVLLVKLQEYTQ